MCGIYALEVPKIEAFMSNGSSIPGIIHVPSQKSRVYSQHCWSVSQF